MSVDRDPMGRNGLDVSLGVAADERAWMARPLIALDLHRFRSGLFESIFVIKETFNVIKAQ